MEKVSRQGNASLVSKSWAYPNDPISRFPKAASEQDRTK
jgi:hypothetical protein